jgi:hypothetical protein
MMLVFWLLLFLIAASLFLMMPMLMGLEIYDRFRGCRTATCPENRLPVTVSINAFHAAATGLVGNPELRLAGCTRWPERADCGQECMLEAWRTEPSTNNEVAPPKTKKIYHLPTLVAAFAAWLLGAIWHSHYLFRSHWMKGVGLSRPELQQIVSRMAPHLLTVAAPLLFGYGVAWLLSADKKKGMIPGVVTAILLWAALGGTSLAVAGWAGLSGDLLLIEVSYTFLASVLVGAIIGGLSGKLVEESFEQ